MGIEVWRMVSADQRMRLEQAVKALLERLPSGGRTSLNPDHVIRVIEALNVRGFSGPSGDFAGKTGDAEDLRGSEEMWGKAK